MTPREMPPASPSDRVLVLHRERVLLADLTVALRFHERLCGYMGRSNPGNGRGLFLAPCRAIHTCFMRFPLDVIFIDAQHRVLKVIYRVPPWRIVLGSLMAAGVIEIPSGTTGLSGIKAGDTLTFLAGGHPWHPSVGG